jgi:hypothetical protein
MWPVQKDKNHLVNNHIEASKLVFLHDTHIVSFFPKIYESINYLDLDVNIFF